MDPAEELFPLETRKEFPLRAEKRGAPCFEIGDEKPAVWEKNQVGDPTELTRPGAFPFLSFDLTR